MRGFTLSVATAVLVLGADIASGQKLPPHPLPVPAPASASRPPGKEPVKSDREIAPHEPAVSSPIDEFERLPAEQQQQALAQLPSDQRKRVEEQLRKFNQRSPEERQALNNLYSRLHQLPEAQQETVHRAVDRFSKLPADRQQAVREQLHAFSALSSADRAARLRTALLKQSLSRKERGILRDMLPLFP
jgi:phage-related protein